METALIDRSFTSITCRRFSFGNSVRVVQSFQFFACILSPPMYRYCVWHLQQGNISKKKIPRSWGSPSEPEITFIVIQLLIQEMRKLPSSTDSELKSSRWGKIAQSLIPLLRREVQVELSQEINGISKMNSPYTAKSREEIMSVGEIWVDTIRSSSSILSLSRMITLLS